MAGEMLGYTDMLQEKHQRKYLSDWGECVGGSLKDSFGAASWMPSVAEVGSGQRDFQLGGNWDAEVGIHILGRDYIIKSGQLVEEQKKESEMNKVFRVYIIEKKNKAVLESHEMLASCPEEARERVIFMRAYDLDDDYDDYRFIVDDENFELD